MTDRGVREVGSSKLLDMGDTGSKLSSPKSSNITKNPIELMVGTDGVGIISSMDFHGVDAP